MMKKLISGLLCALLLASAMPALSETAGAADSLLLGGTGNDSVSKSCYLPLSNGNLLLAISSEGSWNGGAAYAKGTRKILLTCLKPGGEVLWQTEFGEDGGYTLFYGLTEMADGTVMGEVRFDVDQSWQYMQWRRYSLADGSLQWEGEKQIRGSGEGEGTPDYLPLNGRYLRVERNYDAPIAERTSLRLMQPEGRTTWRIPAAEAVIPEFAIEADGGTLLGGYTRPQEEGGFFEGVAAMVEENGTVRWRVVLKGENDIMLLCGALTDDGGLVAVGLQRLTGEEERLLVLCVDVATGDVRWKKLLPHPEGDAVRNMLAFNGNFLLGWSCADYTRVGFALLDGEGNEQNHWEISMGGATLYSPFLFNWNGEAWMLNNATVNDVDDVLLQRMEIQ